MEQNYPAIANYLYEAGNLNKTPRSWCQMMGTGEYSVAEHIHRMIHIVYALAHCVEGVDVNKMIQMALFHDFAEGRTSDLNYLQQKHVTADEHAALKDFTSTLSFGSEIEATFNEYEARESLEAKLVKDADNIEFLLSLREQEDIGNPRAKSWIPSTMQRFKTEAGKQLAEAIFNTKADAWWFSEKDQKDEWWVTRYGKKG